MKYLLTLLVAVLLTISAWATLTDHNSNSWDNTGAISAYDKEWINVMNNSGASLSRGYVVVQDTADDDGASVTTSTSATVVPLCMVDETIAAGAQGKCQIRGYTDQLYFNASTTAVVGEAIYKSTTAGYSVATSTITAQIANVLGIFLDGSSASGQIEAYLNF